MVCVLARTSTFWLRHAGCVFRRVDFGSPIVNRTYGGKDVVTMAADPTTTGAPGKRKRLTAEGRRERILESAREVFIQSGFAGARTRDLAAAAGVNEALLYRHFASKEELFEAAVAQPLEDTVARLTAVSGVPPETFDVSGEVMRKRTTEFIEELFEAMDDVAPLLGIVLFGDADVAAAWFCDHVSPALRTVQDVVTANARAWAHREFDAELVVQLVFGAIWFLALADRLGGIRRDHETAATKIATLLIDGLIDRPQ
jgi:AcrR family transcriptional regulator